MEHFVELLCKRKCPMLETGKYLKQISFNSRLWQFFRKDVKIDCWVEQCLKSQKSQKLLKLLDKKLRFRVKAFYRVDYTVTKYKYQLAFISFYILPRRGAFARNISFLCIIVCFGRPITLLPFFVKNLLNVNRRLLKFLMILWCIFIYVNVCLYANVYLYANLSWC